MGFGTENYIGAAFREYIQLKLSSPLTKKKIYEIGFYIVSQANSGVCSDCIEVFLSPKFVKNDSIYKFLFTPSISLVGNGKLFCDATKWEKITGFFEANGEEQYIIIGCFKEIGDFTTNVPISIGASYYCIDSVYVSDPKLYADMPNIITPNNDGINDFFEPYNFESDLFYYRLKVYNRWGNKLYEGEKPWNGYSGDSICNSGIYFYIIEYFNIKNNALIKTEKGIVTVTY